MKINRSNLINTLLSILNVVLAFVAGYLFNQYFGPSTDQFAILLQTYELLEKHAYDPLPEAPALEYGMIHGLLQAYGEPYTVFVEPPQHELQTDVLEGHYGGIGVRLARDEENFIILYPFPDGPAVEAGMQDGDRLMRVDDTEIFAETSYEEVQSAIRGEEGSEVTITILRQPDGETLEFEIERIDIPIPSVTWHLEPSEPRLGVIEVNIIAASTADEIEKAVADLQEQGATHFALDLRNNGGGLLDAGIDIARLFLSEGVIIEQQFRGQDVEQFDVNSPGPLADIPLVVLVNHYTASASEIIAGALQAHGRALLIGAPTYGKDSIQLVFDLRDDSSLHVTAARWWVPGLDDPIGGVGLQPDILIAQDDPSSNPVIQAAIEAFFGDP